MADETPTTGPTSAQLWDGLVEAMTAERTWAARHRRASVAVGYLAGLVLAVVFWPRTAEARWSPGAAERITAHREAIEQAAWAYGVPATLLASLGAHETHARPIQQIAGGDYWGVCQVYWPSWAKLLRLEGIAESPLDLLDERTGWLAGAAVLARLRADYPELSLPLLLCRYGCKPEVSRRLRWGCDYSRAVLDNLPAAVWALWQTNTEAAGAAGE